MRTYVMTTGVIFFLLVVAHIWRMAVESWRLAREPEYIVITLIALALSVWAFSLVRRRPASS
jgi:hypothetical protein